MVDLVTLLRQQSKLGPINVPRAAMRDAADRIEALERENAELRAEVERLTPLATAYDYLESPVGREMAEHRLSNLLARIHRDGGHYEAEQGTAKAAADADTVVANLYAAEADNARLREAGENLVRFFDVTGLDTNFLGELRAALAGKE